MLYFEIFLFQDSSHLQNDTFQPFTFMVKVRVVGLGLVILIKVRVRVRDRFSIIIMTTSRDF